MEALCAVATAYVIGGSLGLRPLLRITADEPKYAICAAAHIAYIGAIRRSPAGSRDPAQGETGKPGPRSIGDDGDTPVPIA